ncbi:MAG TPA: LysR family transcriptional regulator [Pseudorhodoferax sp.]|jgi:DNA-binding transcriptional LysR family regulator|nr:LysR family transcriptional regulator [Pseudorhodoferax sp.]
MDIKDLYTLIAIADRGSFAEAGNTLGLSLSAVSSQMRALEENLSTKLFDRSRRPPVLTDAGLDFTNRARELIGHWESMNEALRKDAAGGLLKLGAVHTSVSGVLPIALKHMHAAGQGFDIQLTTGLTHDLEKAVLHSKLDAAILTRPEIVHEALQFEPFVEEKLMVISHHTTAPGTDKEILENTPYVRFNRTARVGYQIQQEMTRRKIALRSLMEIDTLEGVVAMVANGLGSSVVPARLVENEFPETIRATPFGKPPLTRSLGVLMHCSSPRLHLTRQLLDALRVVCGTPAVPPSRRRR